MKKWVILIGVLLNVFLTLTPFIPPTAGFWSVSDAPTFYGHLAALVGTEFTILTGATLLILADETSILHAWKEEILRRLPGAVIQRLRDREFYPQFLAAAENANHKVDICYLAPTPPNTVPWQYRATYYQSLLSAIRRNERAHYRRIIRYSDSNLSWTAELIRELANLPNAHLALLHDRPTQDFMPLALSVQVVDNEDAWLVAVVSHEVAEFRDVHIRDETFARVIAGYFDRLWSMSDVVLANGTITATGQEMLAQLAAER